MAREKKAPAIFLRTNRFGVPWVAVCFFTAWIALGFMTLSSSASIVFEWLQDLIAVSTIVDWMVICVVYLRFFYGMRAQGIDRKDLPWAAPLQPYAAWIALVSFIILLLTGGYVVFISGQ